VIALALFRRSTPDDTEHSDATVEVSADMIAGLDSVANTAVTNTPVTNTVATNTAATNPAEEPSDSSVTEELLDQALTERKQLVQMCLYALDRARSPGVVERLEQGLDGIGVAALRPDGEKFDPAHHEAGGTVPTDDAAQDGLVAETEVVGFTDRGRLLRAPIVIVYKARQS
jgi:molecular chaperone GrpE